MHEFSIATEIIAAVERAVGAGARVQSVGLVLGRLSGVNAESLTFCFTELAESHGMGRAELVIDARPTRVRCRECGCEYETDEFETGCPACGAGAVEIISGYECDIDTITYEEADA
jgi:hydrogenase nickel incorporation protein HypA/HybF